MHYRRASIGLIIGLLVSPVIASGDTSSDVQAQIAALRAQIAALQQQLNNLTTPQIAAGPSANTYSGPQIGTNAQGPTFVGGGTALTPSATTYDQPSAIGTAPTLNPNTSATAPTPLIQEAAIMGSAIITQAFHGGAQAGGTSTTPPPQGPWCPSITRTLAYGSTGDDVAELQTFLAQSPTIYPEGLVTGYFGPATEAAVKQFQTEHSIVASGNAASTGWGVVGPVTRSLLGLNCINKEI